MSKRAWSSAAWCLAGAGSVIVAGGWGPVVPMHAAMLSSGLTMLAPEPDPVPRRWQLTIEPGPMRVMRVNAGQTGPGLYYVMTYKVTNTSGQDLLFTPAFELATDQGTVQRSGRDVPANVTREVVQRLGSPLLQDQISIVGMLLQGEENAREGVAIWPVSNHHVSALEVHCAGFSGETRTIDAYDPDTGGRKRTTLRKSLMVRFQPLGEVRADAEPLPRIESRWVLR